MSQKLQPLTLYRAKAFIAYSDAPLQLVFFEDVANSGAAKDKLGWLLKLAWSVPHDDVNFCDLASEAELLGRAVGDPATGDARLFETGGHMGSPTYADPSRTLLLVRPRTNGRLVRAQISACLLSLTDGAR